MCHFETCLLEWFNHLVWHETSEIVLIFILGMCFVRLVLVQCDPPCPRPQLWVQPWQRGRQRGWRCGTWTPITSHTSHQRNIYLRSTVTVRKTHPEERCDALFWPLSNYSTDPSVCLSACLSVCLSVLLTESEFRFARWKKAVQRAMNWETIEPCCSSNGTRLSYEGNV